jgi:hypothetical protein
MRAGLLFEVVIDHDFHLNIGPVPHDVLSDARRAAVRRSAVAARLFAVTPTRETVALLAGHGMIFKTRPGGFIVGIQLEGASAVPRRPFSRDTPLRFALTIVDPEFRDRTAGIGDGFHVFSNASGNQRAGQLFLTRPVAAHQPTRAYLAGDLRAAPAGPVTPLFQAIRDTGPSAVPVAADWRPVPADTHNPAAIYAAGARVLGGAILFQAAVDNPGPNLANAAQWTALGPLPNQYATNADQITLRPAVFSLDVALAAVPRLDLRVLRPGGTVPLRQTLFEDTAPLSTLSVDLRELPDGPYRLEVVNPATGPIPALGQDFYMSSQASAEGWFGFIEIYPGAGDFALLDGAQSLRTPTFHLRFANRAARLRYRFPAVQPLGAGAQVAADLADGRILVTPDPLPLTRIGDGVLLRADDLGTPAVPEAIRLPHHTAPALSKQGGQWFSDIHLSNLPPLT